MSSFRFSVVLKFSPFLFDFDHISICERHHLCAFLNLHKRYVWSVAGVDLVSSYENIRAAKILTNAAIYVLLTFLE